MAKPTGLMRRNGTYYFRIRVPKDLVDALGKKEIKESLNTKEYEEAKKRRNERALCWDAQFAKARELQIQEATPLLTPLSSERAVMLVQGYVEMRDKEWGKRHAEDGPETTEQKREMLVDLGISEQTLTDPEDPRGDQSISTAAEKVLSGTEFALGEGSISYPEFAELVRRGLLELYRRASGRLNDNYSKSYFDQLFAKEGATGKSVPKLTFSELCSEYFDQYREDAKFKKIDQKRIDKVESTLKLDEEIIGSDTFVCDISYDACIKFRDTLAKIPKNMRKHYGDMPIAQAITAAAEDDRPTMTFVTQQGYLQTLTAVLKLGLKKGLISTVPSLDLSPHAEKVPAEDKRKPFTTDQLKAIFSAPPFIVSEAEEGNHAKHGPNVVRGARFWVPLIFLFTGMRPNEICQLYVGDVKYSEGGVWYIDVVKDQEDKKLKNKTSRRTFPVHPELIKIGFLVYVSQQKEAKHERLFPDLKEDKYGYYSTRLADWFSETFLKTVIVKDERQSFYSLRHNFRDALRHADAPEWVLQALGGWKQNKNVSDDYGKKDWPDLLYKWVGQVDYPGLDLSHLYVKDS